MTPTEGAAENLLTCIHLALLYLIVFVLYPKYRVDALRHRLFVIRGELFDFALANGLAFDDPAYVMLRSSINSTLRFAHKVSIVRFLVLSAAVRWSSCSEMISDRDRRWQAAIGGVAVAEHRQKIIELHEQALLTVARHTLLGSIYPILQRVNVGAFSRLQQRYKQFLMDNLHTMEFGAKYADRRAVAS